MLCFFFFSPRFLCPWSWEGTRPDSGELWSSAQFLFIKQLRPLFEGYPTHLFPDTSHTLQQTEYGSPWEGWGQVKRSLINVRPYIFTLPSALSPDIVLPALCVSFSLPFGLSLAHTQAQSHVLSLTCIPVIPRWIKLPVLVVHFQRSLKKVLKYTTACMPDFHHLHQSCMHTEIYLQCWAYEAMRLAH